MSPTERNLIALLAALSLFLSAVEFMIPKPVPFFRLGLANLPLVLSIGILSRKKILLLALLKVVGQGLIHGTLFSYALPLSAAGTLAGTLMMLLLFELLKEKISPVGLAVAGALASNTAQLAAARYIAFGPYAWLMAPPLLIMGLVTSVLLGLFAVRFKTRSRWYSLFRKGELL